MTLVGGKTHTHSYWPRGKRQHDQWKKLSLEEEEEMQIPSQNELSLNSNS